MKMLFDIPIAFAIAMILICGGVRHYDNQERREVQIELSKENKYCIKFNKDNECVKTKEIKVDESR
jgi:hypothetical protein